MTIRQSERIISTLDYERLELMLQRLPEQQSQSQALNAELEKATLVEPAEMPPDVVTMNSSIRFRLNANDQVRKLQLVYPKDLQNNSEQLSVLAPVGMALLGRRQGDFVRWTQTGVSGEIEVVELVSQPEREGLFYR
jgi:regulator of nucleoside diphosphate kinase